MYNVIYVIAKVEQVEFKSNAKPKKVRHKLAFFMEVPISICHNFIYTFVRLVLVGRL